MADVSAEKAPRHYLCPQTQTSVAAASTAQPSETQTNTHAGGVCDKNIALQIASYCTETQEPVPGTVVAKQKAVITVCRVIGSK